MNWLRHILILSLLLLLKPTPSFATEADPNNINPYQSPQWIQDILLNAHDRKGKIFYYVDNGKRQGPLEFKVFKNMVGFGMIKNSDLIFIEGVTQEEVPLESVMKDLVELDKKTTTDPLAYRSAQKNIPLPSLPQKTKRNTFALEASSPSAENMDEYNKVYIMQNDKTLLGPYRSYHQNGIRYIRHENGSPDTALTGILVTKHPNGQIKQQSTHKNGLRWGPFQFFFDNGQLRGEGHRIRGRMDGNWKMYDDHGQLIMSINYRDGVQHGDYHMWYGNGKLAMKAKYKNGTRISGSKYGTTESILNSLLSSMKDSGN